ncbi:jg21959, partial [Pararge aegeria aegeria]
IASPPQPSTSEAVTVEISTSVTSVSDRDSCSEKDRDSMWEKDRTDSRASSSISAATLTNGWYSPALSGVSSARIRDNPKHTKESCNRKLLRSDLSLTSHPEMEIDYYDYEVNNAGM